MKKLLIILFLLISVPCFGADRVKVQVQFRKLIFQCQDGTEEVVDASMTGGNTYEHTCLDGKWTNKFKNFDGVLSYTTAEYEALKEEDLISAKTAKVEAFQYDQAHPPVYVEPTIADYQSMIDSKLQEIEQFTTEMSSKATAEELTAVKEAIESKAISLGTSISEKEISAKEISK